MTKVDSVERCARVGKNTRGRDLVVGDLHGHRAQFELELQRLSFNPLRDRVFSVGDLINRGPDSLGTIALLEQPWFHAVLGNHELMLLNYMGCYDSRRHSRKAFPVGCGEWIRQAVAHHPRAIACAIERFATLPLAIHVEDDVPFNITHGDLHPLGTRLDALLLGDRVSVHLADIVTSSRANIGEAPKSELASLRFGPHEVQLSHRPIGRLPLTYVGHSRLPEVTVHNSYVYIDQGVCASAAARGGDARPPTVLEHRSFARWLRGVAVAQGHACDVLAEA